MKTYMSTEARRNQILAAALQLAESDHYRAITRDQIANRAKTATGTINRVFGTMAKLRHAIVERAIEEESLTVIGQAIAENHGIVIPMVLRRKALKALI